MKKVNRKPSTPARLKRLERQAAEDHALILDLMANQVDEMLRAMLTRKDVAAQSEILTSLADSEARRAFRDHILSKFFDRMKAVL